MEGAPGLGRLFGGWRWRRAGPPVGYALVLVSHSGAGSPKASLALRGAPGPPPGACPHAVPGEGCGRRASPSDPHGQGLCSALLALDTQGLAQCWALSRHARTQPRQGGGTSKPGVSQPGFSPVPTGHFLVTSDL